MERGKALPREQHAREHMKAWNHMVCFRNHKQSYAAGVLVEEQWQGGRCKH